jgi:3-oxoacyl-[acyl-carrier-protein] synthase-3
LELNPQMNSHLNSHSPRKASRIAGTGIGIPAKIITNNDLAKIVDTSDEWIRTRTGISSRRQVDRAGGQSFATLAKEAALKALKLAGLKIGDIDFILCATTTPDTRMPSEAARISGELGCAPTTGAVDVNSACAGFISAMQIGDGLIRSGIHKHVLVVGGDMMLSLMDFTDRTTCVLFGDGCAAVILEGIENADPAKSSMIIDTQLYCEPDLAENLLCEGGGSRSPWNQQGVCEKSPFIKMNGKEVFKNGSRAMANAAVNILERNGYKGEDIAWFVPHQANVRILQKVAELVGVPMEKVFVNLDHWGNTSAATIPICLAEMEEQKLLKKGQLVLLDAFGGGYNYGCTLLRW